MRDPRDAGVERDGIARGRFRAACNAQTDTASAQPTMADSIRGFSGVLRGPHSGTE